jgi:hypothetical protein
MMMIRVMMILYPFQQMDGRLEKIIGIRLIKMMTQIMILMNI